MDGDSSLVNFDTSMVNPDKYGQQDTNSVETVKNHEFEKYKKEEKREGISHELMFSQLQKEEEESIHQATLAILQDKQYMNLSPSSRAKKISDTIVDIRSQYSKVVMLILSNSKH